MSIPGSEIASISLADFGQPITLQYRATRRTVTGIVSDINEPGSVLTGEGPVEEHSIEVAVAAAAGVNTDWTATVQSTGITRPVLWVSPPNAGFVKIILGAEQ
ncbi:hypothetical protein FY034_07275 [Trichlorobacter lovleyi]|uniref:hypothetical protein n=1 Tax=Trichlorobacter lovleyi TaxID=313985 RepID=UPI00223EF45E|nr:hypothetical protein [Trichlorobacter lovleyi]QOX78737.1 hypothetical protein FY034_07275 [Trichlorobacter lovleyi]